MFPDLFGIEPVRDRFASGARLRVWPLRPDELRAVSGGKGQRFLKRLGPLLGALLGDQ